MKRGPVLKEAHETSYIRLMESTADLNEFRKS